MHVLGAAKRQLSILKFNFHIDILMAEASRSVHECRVQHAYVKRNRRGNEHCGVAAELANN